MVSLIVLAHSSHTLGQNNFQDSPYLLDDIGDTLEKSSRSLSFFCVLSICEVGFNQRFKARASPLAQVEHKDKEKHQETDEDSPQSGAQHKRSWTTSLICKDEGELEIIKETFMQQKKTIFGISV